MSRVTDAEDEIKAIAWSDMVKAKTREALLLTLLDRSIDAMAAMHRGIEPDESQEGIPGIVPPAVMRAFCDELAGLHYERQQLRLNQGINP